MESGIDLMEYTVQKARSRTKVLKTNREQDKESGYEWTPSKF